MDRLQIEAKLIELALARDRDELVARARGRRGLERSGARAKAGVWLVRAGLWLNPRADERVERTRARRRAGDLMYELGGALPLVP